MLRYILIILLSLLFNLQFISKSHAVSGGAIKSIINLFRNGIKNITKGADDLIRKGTDDLEKIFKSGESSSKGTTIGEIEQLAKQEKYSILEKIGEENHIKNYFAHSKRVVKQNKRFLKDIAEEGGQEVLEELTEGGFGQAADQSLEKLAKENDFYKYIKLNWIGRIYLRSEYYSKPKVENRILLTCKNNEEEVFYFSIIMEDKIKSASLIDHQYFSSSSQSKLFEQELLVLEDLDEFKIMSTQLEKGYNYPKHYFTIFNDQKFIYDKVITGTENPGIIINRAHQDSNTSTNKCYKATENGLL